MLEIEKSLVGHGFESERNQSERKNLIEIFNVDQGPALSERVANKHPDDTVIPMQLSGNELILQENTGLKPDNNINKGNDFVQNENIIDESDELDQTCKQEEAVQDDEEIKVAEDVLRSSEFESKLQQNEQEQVMQKAAPETNAGKNLVPAVIKKCNNPARILDRWQKQGSSRVKEERPTQAEILAVRSRLKYYSAQPDSKEEA